MSKYNGYKKKRNKIISCTNCGLDGHQFRNCTDPVTSWGVILVNYGELKTAIHNQNINLNTEEFDNIKSRVKMSSTNDMEFMSRACENIRFLMISRKHSVCYVEFIRGRYRPEKPSKVMYLFSQMTPKEIRKIKQSLYEKDGFEHLWREFWGKKYDEQYLMEDKAKAKKKYTMLTCTGVDGPEINLEYVVNNVEAEYKIKEWGFPKGRRNITETEKECAISEFKEESGYTENDFRVIDEIEPLVEDLIGTNGIKYRHVYYVAELTSGKPPMNNLTESQRNEVGDIQFINFQTAIEIIREYHVPKKVMLSKLFTYYLDRLLEAHRKSIQDKLEKQVQQMKLIVHKKNSNSSDISSSEGPSSKSPSENKKTFN